MTHYRGQSYLTVIDCGPSRYGIWRLLRRSDAAEVTSQLETIFLDRGAPAELLLDNATEFRGRGMAAFAARWGVTLRFRAVHEAGGNGIVERHHRTIKVMAARQGCTIGEAVHRYNMTPRDGQSSESAPAAGLFQRMGRDLPGDTTERNSARPPPELRVKDRDAGFRVGDLVWMRRRGPTTRCTDVSRTGTVTRLVSDQLVEVDGVPWHVRCLRRRRGPDREAVDSSDDDDDDDPAVEFVPPRGTGELQAASHEQSRTPSLPVPDADPVRPHPGEPPDPSVLGSPVERERGMRARQPPDRYGLVLPSDCI